jgi:hypothetical protein
MFLRALCGCEGASKADISVAESSFGVLFDTTLPELALTAGMLYKTPPYTYRFYNLG